MRMIIASSDEPNKVVRNMQDILDRHDCDCKFVDEREVDYTIDVGDYHIVNDDKTVVVERKTWGDYTNSLIEPGQRLKAQHFEMSANVDVSYIILTDYLSFALSNHKRLSLKGVISSLIGDTLKVADRGRQSRVNIITLENPKQFAFALWAINKKIVNDDLIRKAPIRRDKVGGAGPCVSLLAGINGIGRKKADTLLKKFGAPMQVGEASVRELMEVNGIGDNIARGIKKALTGEDVPPPAEDNEFADEMFGGEM